MKLRRRMLAFCLASIAGLQGAHSASGLEANLKLIRTDRDFTADRHILDRACIMVELYYRMEEDEAILFDPEEPSVIFGRVSVRHLPARQAEDSLDRALATLRARVAALASSPMEEWSADQKALRKVFPAAWSGEEALASAGRADARRGMRRTFRQSLERSQPYAAYMDSVFRAEGLPPRLMHLAHIESWFKPMAVSPAGAVGIFQLLRSTGSRHLSIDDLRDERLDPHLSTVAAARFLKSCQRFLGTWPLAIMAYNNGPGQISEAVKETGSKDPSEIIQNYEAGGFKSVSRNYYAMFLAASSLAMRADELFPGMRRQAAPQYKILKLEHDWTPSQLRVLSGYSTAVIRRCNPGLRPVVFERNLALPKGYELRLPLGLPSPNDLQFADLRIEGAEPRAESHEASRAPKGAGPDVIHVVGVPVPAPVHRAFARLRASFFPSERAEDLPLMAYMHSQGLLDAGRLAMARRDSILIEPHPVLLPAIRNSGG
jgi:membrane-bound lytic murein transglycosylase D